MQAFDSAEAEIVFLAAWIETTISDGIRPDEIGFLVRSMGSLAALGARSKRPVRNLKLSSPV